MHRTWKMAVFTALAFLVAPSVALAGDSLTPGVTSVTGSLPQAPVGQVVQTAAAATGTVGVNAAVLNGNAVAGNGGATDQTIKNETSTEARTSASGDGGSQTHQHAAAGTRTTNVNASALNGNSVKGDGGSTSQRIDNRSNTTASTSAKGTRGDVVHKAKRRVRKVAAHLPKLHKPKLHKLGLHRPELHTPELKQPELTLPELEQPELKQPELPKPDLALPELGLPKEAPTACSMGDWLQER